MKENTRVQKNKYIREGMSLVTINSLTERFMGLVEKGWIAGGWWFVGGVAFAFTVLCLGMHRSNYR